MTNQNNRSFRGSRNEDSERRNAINLTKTFPTFEDGYMQLVRLVPEVKVYCGDSALIDSVIGNILDTIKDNIPSTENSRYPNTFALSIDSHEVGLKTDSGIAFGWRTYYQKHDEGAELVYKFRVTFVAVNTHHKAIISNMKDNDWESFETNRQSRFWNRTTGDRRRRRFSYGPPSREEEHVQEEEPTVEESTTVVEEVQESVVEEVDMNSPINEDIASQLNGVTFASPSTSDLAANCYVEK